MLAVLRREEKYLLTLEEALQCAARFERVLTPDNFSLNGSYRIRSLYFDTTDDRDFHDKLTEQNCRQKIRLRIYSPEDSRVKLELKQKENVYQKKRTLLITREDAQALVEGRYSVLLHYGDPFAGEMFVLLTEGCYRPKTIVEYSRRAFMAKENNIRLTFDSDIRALEGSRSFFSSALPLYPVLPGDQVVFEVKYNQFLLGYIMDLIRCVDRRSVSSSKYCLGRSLGYPLLY
ncbi:polyphosphate polymerase domain-containing protein [Oscillibacter sp.]|uniref:polyphosphate polymerase domain-containing protein n=1 Tax=Oscillibacter sp. TaxID=1945593 RepID=UPI002D7F787A|nr:polyphosphate polymerase domain-containing protein [Oscillibacter sp.]